MYELKSMYNKILNYNQTFLLNSNSYARIASGFWTLPLLISLKKCSRIFLKKNVDSTEPFFVASDIVPVINPE